MKTRMIVMVALLAISSVFAQTESKRKAEFNLENGLALQGYDPVSYFANKPTKGKSNLAASYQGVTYHFASEANKEKFAKNPTAYEPQYGGWCAYAMGDYGKKVEVDPETFKIVNGKLYLFYNALLNNTLKTWNKNEPVLKKQADANWAKYMSKP